MTRARTAVVEWPARAAPACLVVPVVSAGRAPLRVRLLGPAGARELAAWTVDGRPAHDALARLPVPPLRAVPRRLRLEFSSSADDEDRAPWLAWAPHPLPGTLARLGGTAPPAGGPLVVIEYAWPTRALLWLWALVPLALWLDAGRRRPVALPVALGVAAFATSLLLWQRDYGRAFAHWDADDFGAYAAWLARWLTVPGDRGAAEEWIARYTHAHNPLGPAVMALPIAAGASGTLVHPLFSGACSFVALLVVSHALPSLLGVSRGAAAAGVLLYGTHLLFVRAFARPVTDALGHVLTVGVLALLLARLRAPSASQLVGLGVLNVLHPLARPQGLAYVPFVTAAAIAAALPRAARAAREAVRLALWLAVAPSAAVLGLFAAFGWWDNARALLAAADRYRAWFTARDLVGSLAGTLQLLPLLWLAAGRGLRSPPARLLLGWIGYYVGMLIAVRAPFWMRHFLPVLPAAIALSAVGIDAARGRTRTAALAVVAASSAANVAVLAHFVLDGDNLSLRLFSRLTLG